MSGTNIKTHPVHLGRGADASSEPAFTGDMSWYEAYAARHAADGAEGRLVSLHTFAESWGMWEMHPNGHEVVLCIEGTIILHQERSDGTVKTTGLDAGEYAINDPGVWHTADVDKESTVLFITAGKGTQHRPR